MGTVTKLRTRRNVQVRMTQSDELRGCMSATSIAEDDGSSLGPYTFGCSSAGYDCYDITVTDKYVAEMEFEICMAAGDFWGASLFAAGRIGEYTFRMDDDATHILSITDDLMFIPSDVMCNGCYGGDLDGYTEAGWAILDTEGKAYFSADPGLSDWPRPETFDYPVPMEMGTEQVVAKKLLTAWDGGYAPLRPPEEQALIDAIPKFYVLDADNKIWHLCYNAEPVPFEVHATLPVHHASMSTWNGKYYCIIYMDPLNTAVWDIKTVISDGLYGGRKEEYETGGIELVPNPVLAVDDYPLHCASNFNGHILVTVKGRVFACGVNREGCLGIDAAYDTNTDVRYPVWTEVIDMQDKGVYTAFASQYNFILITRIGPCFSAGLATLIGRDTTVATPHYLFGDMDRTLMYVGSGGVPTAWDDDLDLVQNGLDREGIWWTWGSSTASHRIVADDTDWSVLSSQPWCTLAIKRCELLHKHSLVIGQNVDGRWGKDGYFDGDISYKWLETKEAPQDCLAIASGEGTCTYWLDSLGVLWHAGFSQGYLTSDTYGVINDVPTQIDGPTIVPIEDVWAGIDTVIVRTADGKCYATGTGCPNMSGSGGIEGIGLNQWTEVILPVDSKVFMVRFTMDAVGILLENGHLYVAGVNDNSNLGLGATTEYVNKLTKVDGNYKFFDICSTGGIAITTEFSDLFTWGVDPNGWNVFGYGLDVIPEAYHLVPTRRTIPNSTNTFIACAIGVTCSYAISDDFRCYGAGIGELQSGYSGVGGDRGGMPQPYIDASSLSGRYDRGYKDVFLGPMRKGVPKLILTFEEDGTPDPEDAYIMQVIEPTDNTVTYPSEKTKFLRTVELFGSALYTNTIGVVHTYSPGVTTILTDQNCTFTTNITYNEETQAFTIIDRSLPAIITLNDGTIEHPALVEGQSITYPIPGYTEVRDHDSYTYLPSFQARTAFQGVYEQNSPAKEFYPEPKPYQQFYGGDVYEIHWGEIDLFQYFTMYVNDSKYFSLEWSFDRNFTNPTTFLPTDFDLNEDTSVQWNEEEQMFYVSSADGTGRMYPAVDYGYTNHENIYLRVVCDGVKAEEALVYGDLGDGDIEQVVVAEYMCMVKTVKTGLWKWGPTSFGDLSVDSWEMEPEEQLWRGAHTLVPYLVDRKAGAILAKTCTVSLYEE